MLNSFQVPPFVRYMLLLIGLLYAPLSFSLCITSNFLPPYKLSYSKLEADFNNDGILDEYVVYDESSTIKLSSNGIEKSVSYTIGESWALQDGKYRVPSSVIALDVNDDGFIDIASMLNDRVVVRVNDQEGGFKGNQSFILSEMDNVLGIASYHVDSNTFIDLVIIHSGGLSIYLNDSHSKFFYFTSQDILSLVDKKIKDVYKFDFDLDLIPEIVVSAEGSYILYLNGNFDFDVVEIPNYSDGVLPVRYNGDDVWDLVEKNETDICNIEYSSTYWINEGEGVFTQKYINYRYPTTTLEDIDISLSIPDLIPDSEPVADSEMESDSEPEEEVVLSRPDSGAGSMNFLLITFLFLLSLNRFNLRQRPTCSDI